MRTNWPGRDHQHYRSIDLCAEAAADAIPVQPRLSEPSIIRTSSQVKSVGQSTNIGYDIDMRMRSRVQCSHRSLRSFEHRLYIWFEQQLGALKQRSRRSYKA